MMAAERRYFGTDGIRGRVGEYPITPDFVMKLGWAAGRVLGKTQESRVLVGKDTRISGYMFESALEAGLSAAGVDVLLLGPMPTPGVAYLTRTFRAEAGIVISASHNAYEDNGIKFFAADGMKLPDEVETQIEAELDQPMVTVPAKRLGKARRVDDAPGRYIEFCKGTFGTRSELDGIKIVVDCAHGATYHIAPWVFRELGAEVISIGAKPDGININDNCGAVSPKALQAAVLEQGADVGIALDGDGDRLIMVDNTGEIVDGDEVLFVMAQERKAAGRSDNAVVGTLMSNYGLETAIRGMGLDFPRAKVGDRYVMEMLQAKGLRLGGESSGHIICLDLATTGDGIVSALQVLEAMRRTGRPLRELKSGMSKYPQRMINVRIPRQIAIDQIDGLAAAVQEAEAQLAGTGRVLLRPSGTEPLIRVMVEGSDGAQVERLATELAVVVEKAVAAVV
jgi:phosphoglucosamine mutase